MLAQRSPEWFAARKFRLTASDFAAAIGLNPYCSRQKLWRVKTGREQPFEGNDATQWGELNEHRAICDFELETGHIVIPCGFVVHPDFDWLGVSPDGLVYPRGCVEAKCPFSQEPHTEVPVHYVPQVIAAMAITNRDWCGFISWTPSRSAIWRVEYSEVYWNWMRPLLEEFWRNVEQDTEPKRQRKPEFKGELKIERLK